MAIFYLNTLLAHPTKGEDYLLQFFQEHLDDSFEIFFQPIIDGDRPDIILLKRNYGAVVVEVKDWNINIYAINENNIWSYVDKRRKRVLVRSPQEQVYTYKDNLFKIHLPKLGLNEAMNKEYYTVVKTFCYFYGITEIQLNFLYENPINLLKNRIASLHELFKNKRIDYQKYSVMLESLHHKLSRLTSDKAISYCFHTIDRLCAELQRNLRPNPLFTDDIYAEFKERLVPSHAVSRAPKDIVLQGKQLRLAVSQDEKKKIKGVSGSGKSTILVARAISAYRRHSSTILILTYNATLKSVLREKIFAFLPSSIETTRIEISNYHQFFNEQMNNVGLKYFRSTSSAFPDDIYRNVHFFDGYPTLRYRSIFIDEIQDYEKEWIQIIHKYFLEENGELILFGDYAQNIYKREVDPFRKFNYLRGLGRWEELTRSFRNTKTIFLLIYNDFINTFLRREEDELLHYTAPNYIQPNLVVRPRNNFLYVSYDSVNACQKIVNVMKSAVRVWNVAADTVVILSSVKDILYQVHELLSPSIATHVTFATRADIELIKRVNATNYRVRISELEQRKKRYFHVNAAAVKLTTIHSFKGLEAENVFLILTGSENPELVYTGMTRTRYNLIVFAPRHCVYEKFFAKYSTPL